MKTLMKSLLSGAAVAAIATATQAGVVDTLALWTFEESVPTTAGPHAAEHGVFGGNAIGFHLSTATVFSTPVGNGSARSFSSNNWSAGDFYEFTTSTLGYQDVSFGWSQTRSGTGPADFTLQWSADGINFSDILTYEVLAIGWTSGSTNEDSIFGPIALPSEASNLGTVWVRLTSNVTTASGGTNRVDDVYFKAALIPAPGAITLLALAGLVGTRRRRA